jgi:hypothetical protein
MFSASRFGTSKDLSDDREGKAPRGEDPENCITLHAVEAAFTPAPEGANVREHTVNL